MAETIIGREKEMKVLRECADSERAEFVAVYGRRRIGKTFLVKHFFGEEFDFYTSGIYEGSRRDQLALFHKQLNKHSDGAYPLPATWFEAFDQLEHYLRRLDKPRVIVFIDELPWMDAPRSKFLQALELFWNMFASTRAGLKLIVCGSATTWMMSKLIGNKGGLYNRLTRTLRLEPFTLRETEAYLKSRGIDWPRQQIVDCYMAVGGTPYYLSLLKRSLSVVQNIDELFFAADAPLRTEYRFLFRSLFNDGTAYRNVVETLARKARGMTRAELQQALRLADGGMLTTILENLCDCDFLRRYNAFGKKERDALFQLCDLYTLFYLRFVKGTSTDPHRWSTMIDNPQRRAWSGYAFEQVCFTHTQQLKQALGISGILTNVCAWNYRSEEQHAQIDMLIDRRDQTVNICEMKYSATPFELTRDYYDHIISRMELFRSVTRTNKSLVPVIIAPHGLKPNSFAQAIHSVLTIDDLFCA